MAFSHSLIYLQLPSVVSMLLLYLSPLPSRVNRDPFPQVLRYKNITITLDPPQKISIDPPETNLRSVFVVRFNSNFTLYALYNLRMKRYPYRPI